MIPLLSIAVFKASAAPLLVASGGSILSPIAKPVADVLAAFYAIVPNYGVAIMMLSLAWMIIIAPLTLKSTRSMLAMQKLQPQLKKLQAELKNDRQAFAAAQMELFKEHNVSPFGSCLPTLLPLPVFFALFRVIDGLSHHITVNGASVASPSFLSPHTAMYQAIVRAHGHINAFGLDLSKNALSGHSSFAAAIPFYVLLLLMIGTQYLQTSQMMSRNPAANDNPQMKMMKYLPIFFGIVCVRFPAGVILYYAMSNICRMAQQTLMYRYDPKVKALVVQEGAAVEAMTRDIDRKTGGPKGKKPVDTPPARNSRFRDALAQAKQAADGKKKGQPGGSPAPKAKPSTRPAPAGRPAVGPGMKGAGPSPSPATRGRSRPTVAGSKPATAGNGAPTGRTTNGSTRANPPAGKANPPAGKAAPLAAKNNAAGVRKVTGSNGTGAVRPPASDTNGAPRRAPAPNGDNGSGKLPAGRPVPKPLNGAPRPDTENRSASTDDGSAAPSPPPTGAGAGRTGASQPRAPRKRRGR